MIVTAHQGQINLESSSKVCLSCSRSSGTYYASNNRSILNYGTLNYGLVTLMKHTHASSLTGTPPFIRTRMYCVGAKIKPIYFLWVRMLSPLYCHRNTLASKICRLRGVTFHATSTPFEGVPHRSWNLRRPVFRKPWSMSQAQGPRLNPLGFLWCVEKDMFITPSCWIAPQLKSFSECKTNCRYSWTRRTLGRYHHVHRSKSYRSSCTNVQNAGPKIKILNLLWWNLNP